MTSRWFAWKQSARADANAALPIAAGVLALAAVLLSATLNIDVDEMFSINSAAHGPLFALQRGIGFEQQAPLYFILLSIWSVLGHSILALRLFSVICVLATIPVVRALAKFYAPGISPRVVTLLFIANPWTLWAACEMRLYAMITLISALLILAASRAYPRGGRDSIAWRAAFVFFAVVGLYTQYYFAALILGSAIVTLSRSRSRLTHLTIDLTIVAIAFVPMVHVTDSQLSTFRWGASVLSAMMHGFEWNAEAVLLYLFPSAWVGANTLEPARAAVYYLICTLTLGALLVISRGSRPDRTPMILAGVCVGFFFFVAAIEREYLVVTRHFAVLFIPTLLSVAAVVGALSPSRKKYALSLYVSVFALFSALSLVANYGSLAKPGDFRRVAQSLDALPGQAPLLVYDAEEAEVLRRYYHGTRVIEGVPREASTAVWKSDVDVVYSESEVRRFFLSHEIGDRFVLYTDDLRCDPRDGFWGCGYVLSYVKRYYRPTSVVGFFGCTLTTYERRRGPLYVSGRS